MKLLHRTFAFVLIIVLFQIEKLNCSILSNVKDGCDVNKKCLFKPRNCVPFVSCTYFVSYSVSGDVVVMELLTTFLPQSQAQWVAVGFSMDQSMGDDSVVYCTFSNASQQASVGLAYTTGRPQFVVTILNNQDNTASLIESGRINNAYLCRVQRRMAPRTTDTRIKPLNGTYYILLATGPWQTNNQNGFSGHSTNSNDNFFPYISTSPINMMMDTSQVGQGQHGGTGTTPGRVSGSGNPGGMGGGKDGDDDDDDSFEYKYASAIKNDCNKTKGCVSKPETCAPFVDCDYFMSFTPMTTTDVTFELVTKMADPPGSDQWMAVGFSNDRKMGDDAVTYCIYSHQPEKRVAGLAYNFPTKPPTFINDTNTMKPTVEFLESGEFNGTWYCQIRQTVAPSGNNPQVWPLNAPYYILLASGLANYPTTLFQHAVDQADHKYPYATRTTRQMNNITYFGPSSATTFPGVPLLPLILSSMILNFGRW